MVLEIYNESQGDTAKIKSMPFLQQRGIRTDPQTISEIMKEQRIRSMRTTSKKVHNAMEKMKESNNVLKRQFTIYEPNVT